MYCISCGTKNTDIAKFCQQCGSPMRVKRATLPEQAAPATAEPPIDPRETLNNAYALFDAGHYDESAELIRKVLNADSGSAAARSLWSNILEKQNELDKAIAQMEYVVDANPGSIADKVRLDALRSKQRAQLRKSLGEPMGPTTVLPENQRRSQIIVGGLVGAALLIVVAAMFAGSGDEPAALTPIRQGTAQVASSAADPSNEAARNNPAPEPTVTSSLFDGLGVGGRASAPAVTQPRPQPTPTAAAPTQPAPQSASTAPVARESSPAPQPTQPAATRPAAVQPSGTGSVTSRPATDNTRRLSGAEYQNIASGFKARGDKANAEANYTRALRAYREEIAADPSRAESLSRAIQTCQLELKLLGASE